MEGWLDTDPLNHHSEKAKRKKKEKKTILFYEDHQLCRFSSSSLAFLV